eukprot:SAG11_NODE_2553_length_3225_cov_2.342610_3_plen_155_part_00
MAKLEKVCDSCFNYHSMCQQVEPLVRSPGGGGVGGGGGGVGGVGGGGGGGGSSGGSLSTGAAASASPTPAFAAEQRLGLFRGSASQATVVERQTVSGDSTTAVMGESMDIVRANTEKLSDIRDRSEQMSKEASSFASMASQLAANQRKSSWLGF